MHGASHPHGSWLPRDLRTVQIPLQCDSALVLPSFATPAGKRLATRQRQLMQLMPFEVLPRKHDCLQLPF